MVYCNGGRNSTRDWAASQANGAPTHFAWSTGSPVVAQTSSALDGECTRSTFEFVTTSDKQVQYQDLLNSSVSFADPLSGLAIFNAATDGTMSLIQDFTLLTKTTSNEVQADVYVNYVGED